MSGNDQLNIAAGIFICILTTTLAYLAWRIVLVMIRQVADAVRRK